MKLPNLISKVLAKTAPMSAIEADDIDKNMNLWFEKKQEEVKKKESEDGATLTVVDKGIKLLDEWYMRALFAMSFIFIVRWVQDFMNPGDPDEPFVKDQQR